MAGSSAQNTTPALATGQASSQTNPASTKAADASISNFGSELQRLQEDISRGKSMQPKVSEVVELSFDNAKQDLLRVKDLTAVDNGNVRFIEETEHLSGRLARLQQRYTLASLECDRLKAEFADQKTELAQVKNEIARLRSEVLERSKVEPENAYSDAKVESLRKATQEYLQDVKRQRKVMETIDWFVTSLVLRKELRPQIEAQLKEVDEDIYHEAFARFIQLRTIKNKLKDHDTSEQEEKR